MCELCFDRLTVVVDCTTVCSIKNVNYKSLINRNIACMMHYFEDNKGKFNYFLSCAFIDAMRCLYWASTEDVENGPLKLDWRQSLVSFRK